MPATPIRFAILTASFLVLAVPALAGPTPLPLPANVSPRVTLRNFGVDLEPQCNAVYLDESVSTGFYVPVGPGVELADDLHAALATAEAICAFDLGYYNPGVAPVGALVTVYANDPLDANKGTVIAGPYLLAGLPPGVNAFHVEVGGGIVLPDAWLGVAFDDAATGLLSFSPATLGISHDVVWLTPPGVPTNFGGQPPADLFLGLYSSPATATRTATWGSLKALYR